MNAAVLSVSVFPAGRTLVMLAEPPSRRCVCDGAEHTEPVRTETQDLTLMGSESDPAEPAHLWEKMRFWTAQW